MIGVPECGGRPPQDALQATNQPTRLNLLEGRVRITLNQKEISRDQYAKSLGRYVEMSVEVLSWVFRNSEEKLGRRLVLYSLADHANADGTGAWPSVDTIAREARLSRRQVQTCLRALVAAGAIRQAGKSPHGTVIYDVLMGGANTAPPRAESGVGGVRSTASGGAETAPEPSLEQPPKEQPPNPPSGPPALVKVSERNLGMDALAEECGIIDGDPRYGEVIAAVNGRPKATGIRGLFWAECIRFAEDRPEHLERLRAVQSEPELFERALERAIHAKAAKYRQVMDGALLTPGALQKWWISLERMRPAKGGLTPDEIERFVVEASR